MITSQFRKPAVAGSFYPENKDELITALDGLFINTNKISTDTLKALIVPHAGYIYSGQTAAWGYAQVSREIKNPHFVLIGPSHNYSFPGLAASNYQTWKIPLGEIQNLVPVCDEEHIFIDNKPHQIEHSLEVQLPFLKYLFPNFTISTFLTGQINNFLSLSDCLNNHYPDSIYIFSSDLSHYLPDSTARIQDKKTIEAILSLNQEYFTTQDNLACGYTGIILLIAIAKQMKWRPKLIYYDTSATASANKIGVVGYTAIGFYDLPK